MTTMVAVVTAPPVVPYLFGCRCKIVGKILVFDKRFACIELVKNSPTRVRPGERLGPANPEQA